MFQGLSVQLEFDLEYYQFKFVIIIIITIIIISSSSSSSSNSIIIIPLLHAEQTKLCEGF
jgi:hypothetical protein